MSILRRLNDGSTVHPVICNIPQTEQNINSEFRKLGEGERKREYANKWRGWSSRKASVAIPGVVFILILFIKFTLI